MDRHLLDPVDESASRQDEEGPQLGPPTRNVRASRICTMDRPDRRIPAIDEMAHDESFVSEMGGLVSPASLPTSASWESHSDNEARTSSRRDRRKFVDTTTPTLIDEEEEEAEMISLAQERTVQTEAGYDPKDGSSMRRTPGPVSSQSLRRTPGASAMHRSAGTAVLLHEKPDASVLGFGLTLAAPVTESEQSVARPPHGSPAEGYSSSSSSSSLGRSGEAACQRNRPPLAPGRQEQRSSFTPWTLTKNSQLEATRGACSPNTLRLTEDIGNLLLDEDETSLVEQNVFRQNEGGDLQESWTAPYVFDGETVGNVAPRASRSGKSRRNSGRRSRAGRQQEEQQQGVANFLPFTQPKPVRKTQTTSVGTDFSFGGFAEHGSGSFVANKDERSSPRLFNFGGAFAPAKGYAGSLKRPVASSTSGGDTAIYGGPFSVGNLPGPSNAFTPAHAPPFGSQNVGFQPNPDLHQNLPSPGNVFAPSGGSVQPSPFAPRAGPSFASSMPMTHNQGFSFSNTASFPAHPSGMHGAAPEFVPMGLQNQQQPPAMQFQPQSWSQGAPTHYGGPQGNWSAQQQMGWSGEEYNFGMPTTGDHMAPAPMRPGGWGMPESHHQVPDAPVAQGSLSAFGFPPTQAPTAQRPSVMPAAPPSFAGPGFGDQQQQSYVQRNPQVKGPQRKGSSRKGARQARSDKAQKAESNSQPSPGKKGASVNQKKKKQNKSRIPSPSDVGSGSGVTSSRKGSEDGAAYEGDADARRAELSESPNTRQAFKDFYRKYRSEERSSFRDAEVFALQSLDDGSLPEKIHWRVYLELADLAKRSNRFDEARQLYRKVCELQPYASQGWLEYSKLEEECGHLKRCAKILHSGLEYCEFSENLLTRAVKHEEKTGNLGHARELLARLKHVGIDKVWRTVLEGALLEARAGNDLMARRVLKYLMHHVPWYGPLYLEAYRLERDLDRPTDALAVVERGLAAIPRYGPLWFGAFRLCEIIDISEKEYELPRTMAMIERAASSISKELIWKVHLEAAQMLERAAVEKARELSEPSPDAALAQCRERFSLAILACPVNLRWKVWLAAGRMEVAAGRADKARLLFLRAQKVVPEKGRAATLLECARLEEFEGNTELASAILCKSRFENGSDWKVWLESVLLEVRRGDYQRAIELVRGALSIHAGTGRLWAALVQLRHFNGGEMSQYSALKRALNAVPKSGEVWCEGGRIHLNPFCYTFDIERARHHLFFATKFTPQYGDSFLETLRLELLEQWILPIAVSIWEASSSHFLSMSKSDSDYEKQFIDFIIDVAQTILIATEHDPSNDDDVQGKIPAFISKDTVISLSKSLNVESLAVLVDIADLKLRCANADPNYGLLWFHCRVSPTDTARRVLARAMETIAGEMKRYAHIYVAAIIRRFAVMAKHFEDDGGAPSDHDSAEWEEIVDGKLHKVPPLHQVLGEYATDRGMALLESSMTGSEFVTGVVELNRHKPVQSMRLAERKKALFGTDALFS